MTKHELRISLFGAFVVTVGGQVVTFRTDAERVLLAYLALQQGLPQRRDSMAALLSPERNDSDALTYLRNRLSRLRSALGGEPATDSWFDVDRKAIAVRTSNHIHIDLIHFEQLVTKVEEHAHRQLAGCPTCLASLQEAINLVRGELLTGLNFPSEPWEAWLLRQREYWQQRSLGAMTLLRDAQLARGEWSAALAVAQRQLALEPWLESAHRAVMHAHFQLGNRNAALAQYEACTTVLWEELGVDPEEETQRLQQQIADAALETEDATEIPNNLPRYAGHFFGRTQEKAALIERLVERNVRLMTLTGPGGSGKTRLAIEVGDMVKASFPDGVWFVPLVTSTEILSTEIISTENFQQSGEQIQIAVGEAAKLGSSDRQLTGEQVLAILRSKRMLILLDNCEVALAELGFVSEWLKRAPHLVIMATSRMPLNFAIESLFTLDGLAIGSEEEGQEPLAAEALFAERAQMARSDFRLTSQNLPQVRQICRLVDGLPLAIALAAAWVRRRSLAQILATITDSLDFLSSEQRDVEPRHRSVRTVFETSWQLLSTTEQALLRALTIFPASFSAQAAVAIAQATIYDLDQLCDKSMLQQQQEAERYSLHSLVRQFAMEKLVTGNAAVEHTFVEYFYRFAGDHQNDSAALQPEWHNFAAAISKAHAKSLWQRVLDFVQVLDAPWFRQIRFGEMRAGLALALDAAAVLDNQPALARTLLRLGEVEMELNHYSRSETHLNDALAHFLQLEDGLGIAHAQYFLGRIKNEQAQDEQASQLFQESKRIFAEEEDWLGVAKNLNLLALTHVKRFADYAGARKLLEESIAVQQRLPPSPTYIEALRYSSRVSSALGEYEAAAQQLREAASQSRTQQDEGEYAALLFERTVLCRRLGEFDAGLRFATECLNRFRAMGSLRWEALVKTQLGLLHQAKLNYPLAVTLIQEGLQLFTELGDCYEAAYSHYFLHNLYQKMGKIEESTRSWQEAQQLNLTIQDAELEGRLAASLPNPPPK